MARGKLGSPQRSAPVEDSDSETGSDSESGAPAPELNIRERRARATAGRNFTVREGKEKEDDEAFWNHADFQDRSSDSDVEFGSDDMASEGMDSADSDIDNSAEEEEPAPQETKDDEAEAQRQEAAERARIRRKIVVPGAKKKTIPLRRFLNRQAPGTEKDGSGAKPKKAKPKIEPRADRARRLTTQRRTAEAQQRLTERAAELAKSSARREKKPTRRLTQMERLEEAKRTEERNLEELQRMKHWEDEARQLTRRALRRKRYVGPRIRFVSRQAEDVSGRGGRRFVAFCEFIGCEVPKILRRNDECSEEQNGRNGEEPRKRLRGAAVALKCAVTGLPARYRDPLTRLPYAHKEAFAELRATFAEASAVTAARTSNG